jgi:ribosomal-protein-alanine N-acetyltransferase
VAGTDGESSRFVIRDMTAEDARAVAAWRYEGEYAFYDASADADDLAELLDPGEWGRRYFSADDDVLVGFVVLKDSGGIVEIGLALRPELTGKGLGRVFVNAGLSFAAQRYGDPSFELAVAAFNERAITVYQRAGFKIVQCYLHETNGDVHPFVRMARGPLSEGSSH